ncbi:uncharacterized protein A4U43_C04F29610 [Asparagus officinalis]|uniref:Uncharacterized protein n=1 Tax=Asparagus officinalis TaxID=4686 RepID=A0A5P1F551_ASPOF|nr:uncharacterized protein A4U43_C04F29610 [Asparagus officinalis]
MPAFSPFLLASLKCKQGVGVDASVARAAKRVCYEEVAIDRYMRDGQAAAIDPEPNFGATSSTNKSILPTSEVPAITLSTKSQVLVQLDQPTVSEGMAAVTILVPSDRGEEEEELLDYAGEDDTDSCRSPDVDSPAKDLETISGTAPEATGEYRVGALASPQPHVIEQVDPLAETTTRAEEETIQ